MSSWEVKGRKLTYQASSPDEAALVAGAELLGYQFHVSYSTCPSVGVLLTIRLTVLLGADKKAEVGLVNVLGASQEHHILNVCEFYTTCKPMSTVDRYPHDKVKLCCVGADTVILERRSLNEPYTEKTLSHLEVWSYFTHSLRIEG